MRYNNPMTEYATNALILDREAVGDVDSRIVLYTELLGKVTARATAARKIVSKLGSHLEPLRFGQIRLVEKNGMRIADALTEAVFQKSTNDLERLELLEVCRLIAEVVPEKHPDADLWELIVSRRLLGREILKTLGFDPVHARCDVCHTPAPKHFLLREHHYVCARCLHKRIPLKEYFSVSS